jgi:cyanate permease
MTALAAGFQLPETPQQWAVTLVILAIFGALFVLYWRTQSRARRR